MARPAPRRTRLDRQRRVGAARRLRRAAARSDDRRAAFRAGGGASDRCARGAGAEAAPRSSPSSPRRASSSIPMLDAATGQQTTATALLESRVSERLTSKSEAFEILPFQSANLAKAQLPPDRNDDARRGRWQDAEAGAAGSTSRSPSSRSGTVVAQATALAKDEGLDHTPLAVLPRQPGAGEGQGDRRLCANVGDAGRPARRPVLSRADRRGDPDPRSDDALQRGALRRGARPLPERSRDADRRAAARRERHLSRRRQARPHRRGRAGVRTRRRARHRLQRARREVPVQSGQHRVLVRSEGERRLFDVAAPDRARRAPARRSA